MEQTKQRTEEATTPPKRDTELVRPVEGRIVAGLGSGLAARLGAPTWLIRTLFALLALAGGLGVALYVAGWFLTRSEDEDQTPAQRLFSGGGDLKSWVGLGLVVIAFVIFLDNFSFVSGGFIWALSLLVIGILLYTVDFPEVRPKRVKQSDTDGDDETLESDAETPAEADVQTTEVLGAGPQGPGLPATPTPMPPDVPSPKKPPRERSILGQLTLGVIALSLGILALFDNTTDLVQPGARQYVALGMTILGIGLLVGTLVGRARWLILIGILALPVLAASIAWDWGWTGDTVDRNIVPGTFVELAPSYDHGVGEIAIDLTELPWSGQEVDLEVSLGAGNIAILVPSDVALSGVANADVGRIAGPGGESYGIGDLEIVFDEPGTRGELDLDLQLDVGNIEVTYR